MSKVMHNIILSTEFSEDTYNNSKKGGYMLLNRFCIDEDAAFESTKVHNLNDKSHVHWDQKGTE